MLFISIAYLLFFVIVVSVYFALPQRFRWIFLLCASYFYYMSWDPKYALVLMTTTVSVYGTALLMHGRPQSVKRLMLVLSLVLNLSILFLFKYYNFFSGSLNDLFGVAGMGYAMPALKILMPVGISFFTFQAIGYTIDVYRGNREPERNLGMFALYVSFFPTILSGPIERSTHLLPQLHQKMEFDYERVTNGLKLMAWGFFQKLVIADRLLEYSNMVYGNLHTVYGGQHLVTGLPILVATYFYMFQVYCDFSGYTDIAIGTAQVMGYELLPNFKRPFFAQSIGEMWRRWHISLISWIRDYLYIPLGGSRVSRARWYFNIVLVFTLSGLWHGAQWTFVTWGALNGIWIALGRETQRWRDRVRNAVFGGIARVPAAGFFALCAALLALVIAGKMIGLGRGGRIGLGLLGAALLCLGIVKLRGTAFDSFLGGARKFWMIFVTFNLFASSALFFKAKSMSDAWYIVTHFAGTNVSHLFVVTKPLDFVIMVLLIIFLLVIHYIQEKRGSIRKLISAWHPAVRWALYYLFVMSIFAGICQSVKFEYFRF